MPAPRGMKPTVKNPGKISKRHFIRLTFTFVSRLLVVDKTPELPKLKEEQ